MTSLDSEYRKFGSSWRALAGGAALTLLLFFAIASTRISSRLPTPAQGEALEIYYKPPPAPPAIKQAPLPKSSHSEKSFSFDFALKEEPMEIALTSLDIQLNHDLGSSLSLKLELQKKFEASRPVVGDISEFMIYERRDVDSKPYTVFSPEPNLPYRLRRFEVEVIMFYFVSARGRPDRISVLDSNSDNPLFGDYAKEAIAKWRFKPAKRNGKPVNCWVQQTVIYNRASTSPFTL